MKKVLLLGSTGLLGKALHLHFEKAGFELFAPRHQDLDVTQADQAESCFNSIRPDLILNAVAHNAVDAIEANEEEYEKALSINAKTPALWANLCREKGSHFIHFSSDYVFFGEEKRGYPETAIPSPINKYGTSKSIGETAVVESGASFHLIRLSRLFGTPSLGENSKKSFLDLMLKSSQEKTKIDVVNDEWSAPTYAPDLAEFTLKLVTQGFPNGIYHGANQGACTWFEWAEKIFALSKKNISLNPVASTHFNRAAKRPRHSELLNLLGPSNRTWEEALENCLFVR